MLLLMVVSLGAVFMGGLEQKQFMTGLEQRFALLAQREHERAAHTTSPLRAESAPPARTVPHSLLPASFQAGLRFRF